MGAQMARLLNFNVNTNFPAVAKTGNYTLSVSQPASSIAPGSEYITTTTMTVPKGDILCYTIEVRGKKYPVQQWRDLAANYTEGIFVERLSPTTLQIVMLVQNNQATTLNHGAWSANIYVNAFNVP